MKLTFRTITGKTFEINEVEADLAVGDLKGKVQESQGDAFPRELMKLVYKGKVCRGKVEMLGTLWC
jgi:hypothetical protein